MRVALISSAAPTVDGMTYNHVRRVCAAAKVPELAPDGAQRPPRRGSITYGFRIIDNTTLMA
jgi:hypothetical protein